MDWLIKKLKGFTKTEYRELISKLLTKEELINKYTEEIEKLKKEIDEWNETRILNAAVKELFNTIGEDDILKIEKGIWTVQGKEINEAEKKLLIAEAKTLLNSKLWRYLKRDIQYRANLAMFEKAQTEMDITAGKLWLYTLDCIETKLNNLK